MAKYVMVVPSSAKEGRDAEYNDWYDSTHIHDICAVPGIKSGRRFDAMPEVSMGPPPATYLAIYEIETDDIAGVMAEMGRRAAAGEMVQSDALDIESARIWIYKQH
jgi:hypothetical protein